MPTWLWPWSVIADLKRQIVALQAKEASLTAQLKSSQVALSQVIAHINSKESAMASPLDPLTAQVAATVGAEQSAITLIQGLAAALAAAIAANNPAALQALVTQLNASATALAAAVAANPSP